MKELGNSFSFIGSEYKIKLGNTYNHDKTIGIIICKYENRYIIKYCSDSRIISREYQLV